MTEAAVLTLITLLVQSFPEFRDFFTKLASGDSNVRDQVLQILGNSPGDLATAIEKAQEALAAP